MQTASCYVTLYPPPPLMPGKNMCAHLFLMLVKYIIIDANVYFILTYLGAQMQYLRIVPLNVTTDSVNEDS